MNTTPDTKVVTALDDARQQSLDQLTATTALLRRLKPKATPGSDRVPVAAFNASL